MTKEKNNKLIECRDCGKEISINATACPQCGAVKTTKGGLAGKVWLMALLTPIAGLITLAPNATNDGAGVHNFFGIITMVFILWFTKRIFKKIEAEQGLRPRDVVPRVVSFIIVMPTYIAFLIAIIMMLSGASLSESDEKIPVGIVSVIAAVFYFPFLKYFKYI